MFGKKFLTSVCYCWRCKSSIGKNSDDCKSEAGLVSTINVRLIAQKDLSEFEGKVFESYVTDHFPTVN